MGHRRERVVALAVMGGVFSGWLSVVLGRLAWSLVRLPILSMPFALVAMFSAAAGSSLSTLTLNSYAAPDLLRHPGRHKFLSAFGNLPTLFPAPLSGSSCWRSCWFFSRYYVRSR